MRSLVHLATFARKYRGRLLVAFVFLLAGSAFSLIVPGILREAIDEVVGHGERDSVLMAAVAVFGASTLQGLFGYGHSYISEAVSLNVACDIKNAMYDRLQRLSFAYHDKSQTGQLMSRATEDVDAVRLFIGRGLLGLVQTAVLFIAIVVVLLLLNWRLALVTLVFLPAISLRVVAFSRRLRDVWLKIQQTLGNLGAILEENLTGMKIVKAFSQQGEESRKFLGEAMLLYNRERDADRQMAFNVPLMVFLIGVPAAFVLWYGGREVVAGNLTIGGLTQFIFYLGIMAMPIRRLGFLTNLFSRSISAGERVLEVLERESPVRDKPGAIELTGLRGEVRFESVSFSYDSIGQALEDVSFTVLPGQLVALVGGSGSGKTTVANLLPRFYDVNGGRITVDGIDIRDVTIVSLRRNIGIVQQDVFLFSATIRENIAYGAAGAGMESVVAASKAANLHRFVVGLSDGYETWVGERGITLSGGEKQRLALARTLLTDPRILILDDSTSSVDAETELVIRQSLNELVRDRTTFVITHRLPVIKNADLIVVLKDGKVVEQGRHIDLMWKRGVYSQMYDLQSAFGSVSGDDRSGSGQCT